MTRIHIAGSASFKYYLSEQEKSYRRDSRVIICIQFFSTTFFVLPFVFFVLYFHTALSSCKMFNVYRRGPASISRVFSAVARIPSTGPSTLALSFQKTAPLASGARRIHVSPLRSQEAAAKRDERLNRPAQALNVDQFDQLIEQDLVHPNVVRAITEGMGHHTMTQVQSLTINQALRGTDM